MPVVKATEIYVVDSGSYGYARFNTRPAQGMASFCWGRLLNDTDREIPLGPPHPPVIHFAQALLAIAIFIDVLATFFKRLEFYRVTW